MAYKNNHLFLAQATCPSWVNYSSAPCLHMNIPGDVALGQRGERHREPYAGSYCFGAEVTWPFHSCFINLSRSYATFKFNRLRMYSPPTGRRPDVGK